MKDNITIRELIYLDIGKTASLFSQLRGGLTREFHEKYSTGTEGRAGLKFPIIRSDIKLNETDSITEVIQVHHDMLVEVEDALQKDGKLVTFDGYWGKKDQTPETIHSEVKKTPYVRIEGKSEFRDFDLVKRLMEAATREQSKGSSGSKGKRKNKSNQTAPLNQAELIDLIVPNRIHFAVQPFPGFVAYSNLKAECILDRDMDNVIFHYGTNPNVELTVFGAVASVPLREAQEPSLFSHGKSLVDDPMGGQFAGAFNQIFEAIEPLEKIGNFATYPNITVYPYAIYRTIR